MDLGRPELSGGCREHYLIILDAHPCLAASGDSSCTLADEPREPPSSVHDSEVDLLHQTSCQNAQLTTQHS